MISIFGQIMYFRAAQSKKNQRGEQLISTARVHEKDIKYILTHPQSKHLFDSGRM